MYYLQIISNKYLNNSRRIFSVHLAYFNPITKLIVFFSYNLKSVEKYEKKTVSAETDTWVHGPINGVCEAQLHFPFSIDFQKRMCESQYDYISFSLIYISGQMKCQKT